MGVSEIRRFIAIFARWQGGKIVSENQVSIGRLQALVVYNLQH